MPSPRNFRICHPERSEGMNSRLKCNSVFQEYLVGSFEAEAFSGCVVVALQAEGEAMGGHSIEVGVSGQEAAQTANRVFDAALLPWRVRVAEPGLDAKPPAQEIVLAELRSVIEGDGLAPARGQRFHQGAEIVGDRLRRPRLLPHQQGAPRSAFLHHQQELSRFAETHEVGFPIARARSGLHHRRTIMDGNPVQYGRRRPSAIGQTLSATVLLARQPAMQRFVEGPTAPINVTVDRFVADAVAARRLGHAPGNLLRRPPRGETLQNFLTKFRLTFQLVGSTAGMTTQHQLLRALRIVAPSPLLGRLTVALQLTADRRRTPPQNASDAAQRFTVCMQTVNLNPLPEAQLLILSFFHRNTFVRCCT